MLNKKGFTLIETMLAISIGATVTMGGISFVQDNFEKNLESQIAAEISLVLEGMDRRFNNDEFDLSDWSQYSGAGYQFNNRSQVSSFLNEALIATNANCGVNSSSLIF